MIKKSLEPFNSSIKKTVIPEASLKFSFKYFDDLDAEVCPPTFQENYTQTLMNRLKALSHWTVKEFLNSHSKSTRIHLIDWPRTSRPNGFVHLNQQLRDCPAWQFQVSKSEYGRVHGFLLEDTFYVVWLDKDHRVYS